MSNLSHFPFFVQKLSQNIPDTGATILHSLRRGDLAVGPHYRGPSDTCVRPITSVMTRLSATTNMETHEDLGDK